MESKHKINIAFFTSSALATSYFLVEFGAGSSAEPPYKIYKELFVLCVFSDASYIVRGVSTFQDVCVCVCGCGHLNILLERFGENEKE